MTPWTIYSPCNFPGQNTGVGSLFLLQQIFPTQGLSPGLLHCRRILHQLSPQGAHFGGRKCKVCPQRSPFSPAGTRREGQGCRRLQLLQSLPAMPSAQLGSPVLMADRSPGVPVSWLLSSSGEPGVPAASRLPMVLPSSLGRKVQGQTQDSARAAGGVPLLASDRDHRTRAASSSGKPGRDTGSRQYHLSRPASPQQVPVVDTGSESQPDQPLTHRAASGPACLLLHLHVSCSVLPARSQSTALPPQRTLSSTLSRSPTQTLLRACVYGSGFAE